MESWKEIKGYESIYEVSNYGKVRRVLPSGKNSQRKVVKGTTGYGEVMLSKDGIASLKRVHRLVAEAFIPNDDMSKTMINHIDGDKMNNHYKNLEWTDAKHNQLHSRRVLHNAVQSVICIEKGIQFPSIVSAAENTGADVSHILKVLKGSRNTAGGFHWKAAKWQDGVR